MRILRHGNASEEALKIARDLKCDVCEARKDPKIPRPAKAPRDLAPLNEIGFDVKHLPYYLPNKTWVCLNIVDSASSLQQMIPLQGKQENVDTMR